MGDDGTEARAENGTRAVPVAEGPVPAAGQRPAAVEGSLRSVVVVVKNPAPVADLPGRRRVVDTALAAAGWPAPQWAQTTPGDPGVGQGRRAVDAGAGVVFACGGTEPSGLCRL